MGMFWRESIHVYDMLALYRIMVEWGLREGWLDCTCQICHVVSVLQMCDRPPTHTRHPPP